MSAVPPRRDSDRSALCDQRPGRRSAVPVLRDARRADTVLRAPARSGDRRADAPDTALRSVTRIAVLLILSLASGTIADEVVRAESAPPGVARIAALIAEDETAHIVRQAEN